MSIALDVKTGPGRQADEIAPPSKSKTRGLERPSIAQRVGAALLNPAKNFLAPAAWLQKLLRQSASPLLAESFLRPGGWRSMEIIYRNDEPVDWLDRQALRDNPISMASRNRLQLVSQRLATLIAMYGRRGSVNILGVGAGPGRHVQSAIVESGIEPGHVTAHLVDLDDDAFDYGRALAARMGIASSIHFRQGDARSIRTALPEMQAQIVKLVGLVEYLNDAQFLELLAAMKTVMSDDATLVTHGFVDAFRSRRFLSRVFNLRHQRRSAKQMIALLESAGFRAVETTTEPVGVYPIITAVRDARR
jgi:hypothetical protein